MKAMLHKTLSIISLLTLLVACDSNSNMNESTDEGVEQLTESSFSLEFNATGEETGDCIVTDVTSAIRARSEAGPMGFKISMSSEDFELHVDEFILSQDGAEIELTTDKIVANASGEMWVSARGHRDDIDLCEDDSDCAITNTGDFFTVFLGNFAITEEAEPMYQLTLPQGSIECEGNGSTTSDYMIEFSLMPASI